MPEYKLRILVEFPAGHRLFGTNIACDFPHGHNFSIEVVVAGEPSNQSGIVIDFDDIKAAVNGWIKVNWDHAFLVNSDDKPMMNALQSLGNGAKSYVFQSKNPTAEVLAAECFEQLNQLPLLLGKVRSIRLWENASQYVEYGG
jgi:6-pyruvoyltetrahydropterin/6-carboxytetrahydropterin synthase